VCDDDDGGKRKENVVLKKPIFATALFFNGWTTNNGSTKGGFPSPTGRGRLAIKQPPRHNNVWLGAYDVMMMEVVELLGFAMGGVSLSEIAQKSK
jgi:hypothetical protein